MYDFRRLLEDVDFRVQVLDLLVTELKAWGPGIQLNLINMVWEMAPARSPLKVILLQLTMASFGRRSIPSCAKDGELPIEFVTGCLSLAMSRMKKVDDSFSQADLRAMFDENE